jgi:hypothetical protein
MSDKSDVQFNTMTRGLDELAQRISNERLFNRNDKNTIIGVQKLLSSGPNGLTPYINNNKNDSYVSTPYYGEGTALNVK